MVPGKHIWRDATIRLAPTGARAYVECGSLLPPFAARACPGVFRRPMPSRQVPRCPSAGHPTQETHA